MVKRYLKEAQVYFYDDDYYKAWQAYRKVLQVDNKNDLASLNGAICLFKLNYPVDSISPLAVNLARSKFADAKYYLAKIRHRQKLFDEAIALLEAYDKTPLKERIFDIEEIRYFILVCTNAKKFIASPRRSVIRNMGAAINSAFPDYVPVIMPDESALYFTSTREGSSNNRKDEYNRFYEDVYVSYNLNGKWQKAENTGPPVNTETNDACVAISPDGQKMIIYRTSADQLGGDLYLTHLGKGNIWSVPEKIGKEVNSQYIETSACFSNDTSEIYFSSNRPGGYGGKDIYRIKKIPGGQWGPAFNLGPAINTPRDDDAPFLHPDGVTLYFSSQGHNTMGEFDVFKSVLDPALNLFSDAENLGYPINDVGNDIFFVLSVDGQRGFYSSVKDETYGGNDIYQIDTRFGENDLAVEQGTALIGDVPGRVKITLMDEHNNPVNGDYYSNAHTGKFILLVNPLKSYKAIVQTDGYETLVVDLGPLALDEPNRELRFKIDKK